MASAASGSNLPLGKVLASTEKKVRDKAIKSLAAFLSENSDNEIPPSEMKRLWKGIFYCFWMSDKPLVQQALASELAELVLTITSNTASIAFLRGFWQSMVREWNGIDQLRLDKYYMLVRRFVNAAFRLLARAKWDADLCLEYNGVLMAKVLTLHSPMDIKVPPGLVYHLADIYLEELDKVQNSASSENAPVPLTLVIAPLLSLSAQTMSKITFKRLKTAAWEPLLEALSPAAEASEDEEEGERPRKRSRIDEEGTWPGLGRTSCLDDPSRGCLDKETLLKGVRRKIFDVASDPSTRDSNRRQLYTLWKEADSVQDSDDE
uniref:Uncharacterized protein UP3 n=1 Tax=Coprinellus disseminatus TaxID=71703 RepID=Q1WMT7_COPDI|nr:conserved hypothetical protein [Coprinellus disseminatus]